MILEKETALYKDGAIRSAIEGVTAELEDFVENTYGPDMQALEGAVDGKIETYYQSVDPATWDAADNSKHEGDIWYNSTSNIQKTYIWKQTGSTWGWAEITSGIPTSMFNTFSGKANIFVGAATPSNPKAGDLWFISAAEDIKTYVNGSWVKYNKYTDDTQANIAKGTATKYITELSDGIWVTPENRKPDTSGAATSNTRGWRIRDALELFIGTISYIKAWMNGSTPTVQIGPDGRGRTIITDSGMEVYSGGKKLAKIGYGSGKNKDGGITERTPFFTLGERKSDAAENIGNYSIAEGYATEASGWCSHAEGGPIESSTGAPVASGARSHAEGCHTVASGRNSHAQNYGTIAPTDDGTAIGRYNTDRSAAFIIGNGSSASARSDAFYVDFNGNVTAKGDIDASGRISAAGNISASGGLYGASLNGHDIGGEVGDWYDAIPLIANDGVMEVGKYIDFHDGASSRNDYDVRLTASGSVLNNSGQYGALFKVTDVSITVPTLSANSRATNTEYTMQAQDGYTAVGIVGWTTDNYKVIPTNNEVRSNTKLYAGFANHTATASQESHITFKVLWLKATKG